MAKPDSVIAKGAYYQVKTYDENTSGGDRLTGTLGTTDEVTYTLFSTSQTDLSDQIPDYSEILTLAGSVQIRSDQTTNEYWVTHHGSTIVSGTWDTKGNYLKDGVRVSLLQALPGTYFNSKLKDAGKLTDGDLVLHMKKVKDSILDLVNHNFWIGNITVYLTYYPPYFLINALSSNETRGSATYKLSKSQPIAGTSVTFTATPNSGYYFSSWSEDNVSASENTINLTDNMVSSFENFLTRTANFGIYTYSISYNLNDEGSSYPVDSISNQTTYTVETNSFTLTNPTRPGYTFKGWSGTDLTGDTNKTVTISKGSTGNRTYTAHWVENYIEFEYWSNNRTEDNKKFATWKATPSSSSYRLYEFTTDYNITYPGYKPKLLTGYSEGGYYNTKPDGSGAYSVHESYIFSSYLDVCDKYGVNYYEPATTIPIYCQWEPKILVSYDTIFNYYDWYRHEIKPGHATTIVSQNEIGFTIKTNNGGSDGYSNQSPSFKLAKENGQILQEYTIDVDVNGSGWQLFIFFYNDADNAVYYSNGYNHTSITSSGSKITIPTGATKAQIRVDSNESNNQVSFYNFRIYPSKYYYMRYTVPITERSNCGQWSAPANPTRNNNFYKFKHWSKDPSLEGKNSPVTTSGEFPAEDTVLFSQWDKQAPRIFIQEANKTGGKAAPIAQLHNKPIRKAFIYTTDSNKWREC